MKDGVMTISIQEYELLNAYQDLLPQFDIISKWKGVSGSYKGKEVNPFKFVFQILRVVSECSQQRNETWNERHCWQNIDQEGWGCKHLFVPARHLYGNGVYKRSNRFWYNFGTFEKDKTWSVNKKYLFEVLVQQAEEKCCTLCPFFSSQKLSDIISNLPDQIEVDGIHYKKYLNEFKEPVNIRHIPQETVVNDGKSLTKMAFYFKN